MKNLLVPRDVYIYICQTRLSSAPKGHAYRSSIPFGYPKRRTYFTTLTCQAGISRKIKYDIYRLPKAAQESNIYGPVDTNKENTIGLKKLGYFLNRMFTRVDLIKTQWQR